MECAIECDVGCAVEGDYHEGDEVRREGVQPVAVGKAVGDHTRAYRRRHGEARILHTVEGRVNEVSVIS